MAKTNEAIFIESTILPGREIRQDVAEELGDQRAYLLMGAALTLAVYRKFPDDAGPADIQAFIDDMKTRFPEGAEEFQPAAIEAIVRGLRGEVELLDEVDPDYMADMTFMLTYAIMSDENLTGEALDEFVDEVVAMVGSA